MNLEFARLLLAYISTLKMEVICSSESWANFIAVCHVSEIVLFYSKGVSSWASSWKESVFRTFLFMVSEN
jgi:hypothetical protein